MDPSQRAPFLGFSSWRAPFPAYPAHWDPFLLKDIIVGNNNRGNPKAPSESLSKAITSMKDAYAKAEGDAAKKAVAKVRLQY